MKSICDTISAFHNTLCVGINNAPTLQRGTEYHKYEKRQELQAGKPNRPFVVSASRPHCFEFSGEVYLQSHELVLLENVQSNHEACIALNRAVKRYS